MTGDEGGFKYRFKVLGRYRAHLSGNESHVTLNVLAGRNDHLSYCGTLTMSEEEWNALRLRLRRSLETDLEIEDHATAG
jgi:hypothetical protein